MKQKILFRIKQTVHSKGFFSDSIWMLCGNGIGNGLMLVAGIIIARILGKDLYGEYGLVKTTMFYIASLSTFGLGFTITKYVSSCIATPNAKLKSYIFYAIQITAVFSVFLASLLILFSKQIAIFLNEPELNKVLSFLAILIIIRALNTCMIGILAGLKYFKSLAYNVILSGLAMLILAIPLTFYFSLYGSLIALLVSQVAYMLLNVRIIYREYSALDGDLDITTRKELIGFSFPIALQELSFMLCNWGVALMIPKLCSFGEYGIFSAANQWNAIILYIPSVLANVVLSYLSGSVQNKAEHNRNLKMMTKVNLVSSLIPFIIVYVLSSPISSLYGPSFVGLKATLVILVLSTVFVAISNVYSSELISHSHVWPLFVMRLSRDIIIFAGSYFIIVSRLVDGGAKAVALCTVIANVIFFVVLMVYYRYRLADE